MQLESELLQTLRSAMIDNILATDMKQHFSLVSRLQVHAASAVQCLCHHGS